MHVFFCRGGARNTPVDVAIALSRQKLKKYWIFNVTSFVTICHDEIFEISRFQIFDFGNIILKKKL